MKISKFVKRLQDEITSLKYYYKHCISQKNVLFSSYANGSPYNESDLEVYVVISEGSDIRENTFRLIGKELGTCWYSV